MSLRKQVPPRDLPWVDAQGKPTDLFFDYIKNLESRSLGQAVSITDTPANGETPLYNTTTGLWEFGAN
jgi:hypothetical protein